MACHGQQSRFLLTASGILHAICDSMCACTEEVPHHTTSKVICAVPCVPVPGLHCAPLSRLQMSSFGPEAQLGFAYRAICASAQLPLCPVWLLADVQLFCRDDATLPQATLTP